MKSIETVRRESARYRLELREAESLLKEYQVREVRRMVSPFIDWSLFEELVGVENVIDDAGRVDHSELVVRLNAKQSQHPSLISRRVCRADFADEE